MPFKDPERYRKWQREYRAANLERILERDRAYREANREELNAKRRVGRPVRSESMRAARLRAQKRQWWRENRAKWPVKVLVAP